MQPITAFPEATLPYKDCAELFRSGRKLSGSYSLQTADVPEYKTRCEKGWTTIAARNQLSGEPVSYTILIPEVYPFHILANVDISQEYFTNKNLDGYKAGFGDVTKEFFIGLDRLYGYKTKPFSTLLALLNIAFTD